MQDLNNKITGSTLTAAEWNEVPTEMQNMIVQTGQALSSGDLNQLGKAVSEYSGAGDFYSDSGTPDAIVLTKTGSIQSPAAYFDGMRVRFRKGSTNTGATTINVATLGVKDVRDQTGAALAAGAMTASLPYECFYDLASDFFVLGTDALAGGGGGGGGALPNNYITGCEISNNSTTPDDVVDFGTGKCKDAANNQDLTVSAALGKNMAVNWAVGGTPGAPAGGFPSALTRTNSTWYRCFLIATAGGTIDAGFDTSATAANLLADAGASYVAYRQVGWVLNDSVGNIEGFLQDGDRFRLKEWKSDYTGNSTSSRTAVQLTAPPETFAEFVVRVQATVAGGASVLITELDQSDIAPNAALFTVRSLGFGSAVVPDGVMMQCKTDTNSNVYMRDDGNNRSMDFNTMGWRDDRGKQ